MKLKRNDEIIYYPIAAFENISNPTLQQLVDMGFAEYVEPETEPIIAQPIRRLSKLAYMNRFTDSELAAIYTAAKQFLEVEIWLEKFRFATPEMDGTAIDLDDPRTIAGVQSLESSGIISIGRSAEILA